MVDIQSVAAEIRRGKKEEEEDRREKETTGQKYNTLSKLSCYREEVMRTRFTPSASTTPLRDHTRPGVGRP